MARLLPLAAAAAALAGAALAAEPAGEVLFVARGAALSAGASFDAERLVGPTVNLTRREGGGWAGDLAGQNVDLEVSDDHLSGASVDLHLARSGDTTTVRGLYFGQRVSLELSPRGVSGRLGACSVDFKRRRAGFYEGDVGCATRRSTMPSVTRATLRLSGDAAAPVPPMPQLALALIAVLPG